MSECKEKFVREVKGALLAAGCNSDDITTISNIIVSKLHQYELTAKCTDVAAVDTASEQLLKVYGNTLLTEGKSVKTVQGYLRLLRRFMLQVGKPLLDVGVFDIRVWLANEQQVN